MFAIITPALIIGAIAERMKFTAIFMFMTLWMFVVYFPQAHMVWGIDGLMNGVWNAKARIKAIDFAGGTVVHMTSGWSALILCLILGKRMGFGKENMRAAQHGAVHDRHRNAVGGLVWIQCRQRGRRPTSLRQRLHDHDAGHGGRLLRLADDGMAGEGQTQRARLLFRRGGGTGGHHPGLRICHANGRGDYRRCRRLDSLVLLLQGQSWFGYDDALDTFGVHAIGGTIGAFLTGLLARNAANANLATNLKAQVTDQFFQPLVLEQLKAIGLTLVLAIVGTTVIAFIVKAIVGLRPSEEVEVAGLDLADHGEEGYHKVN